MDGVTKFMKIDKSTHIFIPVIDGEVCYGSWGKPQTYTSLKTLNRFFGKRLKGKNATVYEFVFDKEIEFSGDLQDKSDISAQED